MVDGEGWRRAVPLMPGLPLAPLFYPFKIIFWTEITLNLKIHFKITINSHFIVLINDIFTH